MSAGGTPLLSRTRNERAIDTPIIHMNHGNNKSAWVDKIK